MTAGSAGGICAEAMAFAENGREMLVDLCARLVAAPSAQPEGDTRAAASVLTDFLREQGLRPELRSADPHKANVVCTVVGAEPGPHLVLNGHLDTLPAGDLSAWTVPLHEMRRTQGRLTGLGIGNMKAGVAALAMSMVFLSANRQCLSGSVTLTAVADEVVFGPDGAAFLLASDPGLRGDWLLNAEGPGHMELAVAEKGLLWVEIIAEAPPQQGMLATAGGSAAIRLARILLALDEWNSEVVAAPAELPGLAAGESGLRLSVNPGRIQGGTFISQAVTRAAADVDLRIPPGLSMADIEARLDDLAAGHQSVTIRRIKGWDPSWTTPAHPLPAIVAACARAVRPTPPRPVVRLPASDAMRWRALGVPAVCFGPQPDLASGVDDHVLEQDVVDCVAIYSAAAMHLLDGRSA